MNKYEEALDWLTCRCMEPNDDYEGLVYDQVPDFEIEANIEPLRKLIEKTKPKPVKKNMGKLKDGTPYVKTYACPSCRNEVLINQKYCDRCGQKIDWSDYEKYLKEGEQEEI